MKPRTVPDDLRAAFVRFRDGNDLAALATVFDRTAQHLVVVAHHLAAPGVEAEDLVQATFTQAIRNARAFDATRPLEPWLLGILTNEAHNARRRASRRLDAARLAVEPTEDPAARAADRELAEHVAAALASFPDRLREVVTMHLVHGMKPTEIAHVVGRPVGTVKSWIHRSLEKLRQRLPAAMAVAAMRTPPAPVRLASMREAVLSLGGAAGGLAASAAPLGIAGTAAARSVLLAPRWLAVVAVVLTAAGALAWRSLYESSAGTVSAVASVDRVSAPPPLAANDAGAVPDSDAPRLDATASQVALGLVVRWHDGTPAVVSGWLQPRYLGDASLRRRSFTTGVDGRVDLGNLEAGEFELRLDRGLQRTLTLSSGRVDLDLTVPRGRAIDGKVLDPSGRPIAATIWIAADERRDDGFVVATTAGDGTFTVRDLAGGSAIAAFADGFVPSRCVTVREARGEAVAPQVVELWIERAADTLAVRVIDAAGQPVTGARVQIGGSERLAPGAVPADDCRPPPPWAALTDEHGVVECRFAPRDQRVPVFARSADAVGASAWARVGDAPPVLTLASGASIAGAVDVPPGSEAVARVLHEPKPGSAEVLAPAWFWSRAVVAPSGRFELTGLPLGPRVLEVRCGQDFAQHQRHFAAGPSAPWQARLSPGGQVRGVARRGDGTPLAGHRVELHAAAVVHRAEVSAQGLFGFEHVGELAHELVLFELEERGGGILRRASGVTPGMAPELVLPAADLPSCTVRGRLLDAAGKPLSSVEVERREVSTTSRTVPTAADGTFVVTGLRRGPHTLLGGNWPYAMLHAFDIDREDCDLGTIRGAAPAGCEVVLDADRRRERLEVNLISTVAPMAMVAVARWIGPDLGVEMPAPAGDYVLSLNDEGVLVHQQVVSLVAGGKTSVQVPASAGVVVEIQFVEVEPLVSTWAQWRIEGGSVQRRGTCGPRPLGSNSAYRCRVALPPGRYGLQVVTDQGRRAASEVVVGSTAMAPLQVSVP